MWEEREEEAHKRRVGEQWKGKPEKMLNSFHRSAEKALRHSAEPAASAHCHDQRSRDGEAEWRFQEAQVYLRGEPMMDGGIEESRPRRTLVPLLLLPS